MLPWPAIRFTCQEICQSMQQRARVFIAPQTPDNFLSIYMSGSLSISELDRWVTQLWFDYGIVLYAANIDIAAANDDRTHCETPNAHYP